LAHAPIANLNPEGYVKLASESVQAVLQNLMDLIRQTGHGTEAGLIGILNQSPSLCMRVPAALFLGLPEVRTDDSDPWLKKILSNNSEHPLLKIAAARSLLNNDNAEEETWNRAMQFLKSWADATYPSWESVTKRAGINNAQDALSMLAQREIPSALVLMFS
jgi:cytochrome P450